MKRTFYKEAYPKLPGLSATLPKYYTNRYSVTDGDRSSPNRYTLRKAEFFWAHATRVYGDRRSWYNPVTITSLPGADDGGLTPFYLITEYDTSNPQLGESEPARSIAIGRLLASIKANDWNAAVSVSEMSESWRMIISAARRLYASRKALQKGNLKDAYAALGISDRAPYGRKGKRRYPPPKSVSANASRYWLEMNLGWGPLLSDLHDGAKAIATAIHSPPNPQVVKVRGRGSFSRPVITGSIPADTMWHSGFWSYSVDIRYEVGVYYTYSKPMIAMARAFGLTNPMSLAWETFPLSFVFDYVVNVGEWLENLTAYHGLEFLKGYETHCCTQKSLRTRSGKGRFYEVRQTDPQHGSYVSQYSENHGGTMYVTKTFSMSRTPIAAFPNPNPPRVTSDLVFGRDSKRAVTLLSLFRQFSSK